ncbi:WxL domain-containing protein [Enterococcus faecalis]|uniref:WxL domain-containing protein n=1 Tax=Enterococcus faecalis TaxID=1351 RepID=UPI003BA02187
MKQIRFKHLATLGVCCSLFSNSLAGVTAVAETMTIESSPTAASHEQTASTKESAETEVKETQATETSEAPTEEKQEEQENGAVVVKEETKETSAEDEEEANVGTPVASQPNPLITPTIGTRAGNLATIQQQILPLVKKSYNPGDSIIIPSGTMGLNIISDDNTPIRISDFNLDVNLANLIRTTAFNSKVTKSKAEVTQTSTGFNLVMPEAQLVFNAGRIIYFDDVLLQAPKYISNITQEPLEVTTMYITGTLSSTVKTTKKADGSYAINDVDKLPSAWQSPDVTDYNGMYSIMHYSQTSPTFQVYYIKARMPQDDLTLVATHKKVTESFKNQAGATIPPPPNFEEGRKTSITNNDFTYTQSGTLPKSYKGADGRTYFLKGWYKGKTKPNTLETGTPTYKVTYDDNDDLTVVYEEPVTRVVTVPAVTYQFGFVTEKGTYVYDAKVTGNATEVANDEKTTVAPLISKANGIYQEIAVPTRRLSYHDQLSSFYGVTDFNLKIPKYYKTPTVKPGSYFTGPAGGYPTAVISNRNLITNAVINSESTGVNYSVVPNSRLGAGNYSMSTTTFPNDTTKTAFARPLSEAQATNSMIRYNTTDAPMLYFLENRRINARYVDQDGNKLTSLPPDVKQDAKTPITSDNFTFMHGTTLPDSYKGTDGKTYKFKGWYRGKSKPNTLQTTKQPSYQATYGDNDDLTVVYDSREMVDFPALTYQFGFVDETGKRVDATKVGLTYDNWVGKSLTGTTDWTTVSLEKGQVAPTKNNLKEIAYPSQSIERKSGETSQFSAANLTFTLPRYYEKMSVYNKTGAFDTAYPFPNVQYSNSTTPIVENSNKNVSKWFELKKSGTQSFVFNTTVPAAAADAKVPGYLRQLVHDATSATKTTYYTIGQPVYYYLTNRKVTENFIDPAGNKLTDAPTGFKQGQQTAITTDPYTYTSAKALPASYKGTDGKTYIFKGWYRGKTKPNTLETTKTPSYQATFDGNDDLNVVYEAAEVVDFPALTYQFGFVDEAGKRVDATKVGLTYDNWAGETLTDATGWKTVSLEKGQVAPTKNNLKEIAYPSHSAERVSGRSSQFSAANLTFTLPRYYEKMSVYNKNGTFDTAYPLPNIQNSNFASPTVEDSTKNISKWFELKKSGAQSFVFNETTSAAPADVKVPAYLREMVFNPVNTPTKTTYYTIGQPVYYYLTNRKVTENFIDPAGNKLTDAPTGFKQGQQTAITTDPYTYTSAKALPASYKGSDGKTYIFKGWYRGKTKPNTLETTKTPSYQATFDGNDDLNVVYEAEQTTTVYPSMDVNFIDETGVGFTPALTFSGKYQVQRTSDMVITPLYDLTSKNKGAGQYTLSVNNGTIPLSPELFRTYGNGKLITNANKLRFKVDKVTIDSPLKYVDTITLDKTKSNVKVFLYSYTNQGVAVLDSNKPPTIVDGNLDSDYSFKNTDNYFSQTSSFLNLSVADFGGFNTPGLDDIQMIGFNAENNINSNVTYTVTRKKVTEKFVNPAGAPINPPTGYTQNKQTPMTSNDFTFTQAGTLPASYKGQDGKTYIFKGWYKGKAKPDTLKTTKTPSYPVTFDGNDDLNVVYEEGVASVEASLKGVATIMPSGGSQLWNMIIKNTGTAPLTGLKVTPTANWSSGLATPIQLSVKVGTGGFKNIPVTKETWKQGIALDTEIPVGQSAMIQISTVGTGAPLEVLQAELNVTSNAPTATVSSTVRIQGTDQEVTDPVGEGFISLPTFDFGQVGIAGTTTQHGLKKAADYYGNGIRNPFVRIKKSQPNWSLTAQLSQPKSAKDSLPTATRLLLGQAAVSKVDNYNLVTEMLNPVGTTSALSLTANNAVTNVITNKQFTGNDVYHLDFTFNNVKLEVPANQGTKGEQYNATVTWNLVTGP